MKPNAPLAASMLDSTLSAQAAGVALCLRERRGEQRLSELGTFDDLVADARVRLQHMAEALALGHAEIYLAHVEWLRAAHLARGLDEELLLDVHACVRASLREGLAAPPFAAVAALLEREERFLRTPWQEPKGPLDGPQRAEIARLLELFLTGQRTQALSTALELERRLGPEAFVLQVLVGVQRELGRLWQRGEIHVGEEHLASRLTEEILTRIATRDEDAPARCPRVVVASTAGDLHDIGARMVALHFRRAGWDVCFLGANVPCADLTLALRDLAPALLALSVTLGVHLRGAAAMIAAAHALTPRVPVLVGGAPFLNAPEVWKTIGADAQAADAPGALRAAQALLPAG